VLTWLFVRALEPMQMCSNALNQHLLHIVSLSLSLALSLSLSLSLFEEIEESNERSHVRWRSQVEHFASISLGPLDRSCVTSTPS
jgi:hypothetical protein